MSDRPVDLDAHRGFAAQKETDLRRTLATAESAAAKSRERQMQIETQLRDTPAASWPEAAAKARYMLNLYAAMLTTHDTHHRDLVASILRDFDRLNAEH